MGKDREHRGMRELAANSATERAWKYINVILILVSILILLFHIASFLYYSVSAITYPFELDYGEGIILDQALKILKGQNIYGNIQSPPYLVSGYQPLYLLLSGLLVKMLGLSFLPGRLLSFLSAIGISVLIFYVVRTKTGSLPLGFLAAGIFLSGCIYYKTGYLFRVDTLSLFFAFLGISFAMREDNLSQVFLSPFLFILALFTRQSMIAAPLALLLFTYLYKRRIFWRQLGVMVVLGGAALLLLELTSGGQFFQHVVTYTNTEYSLVRAFQYEQDFLRKNLGFLVLAIFYFLLFSFKKRRSDVLLNYLVLSFLITLTVGNIGSNTNYFMEVFAVVSLVTPIAISEFSRMMGDREIGDRRSDLISISSSFLTIALLLISLQLVSNVSFRVFKDRTEMLEEGSLEANRAVLEEVRAQEGIILSEDIGMLVLANKSVYFEPHIFTQLTKMGLWDQRKILKDIEAKKFSLVVLEFDLKKESRPFRFTEEMLNSLRASYLPYKEIENFYLYTPR